MGIRTESILPTIPDKSYTPDVDWLKILDDFDPSTLEKKYLVECARRNSRYTYYNCLCPPPVEERIQDMQTKYEGELSQLKSYIEIAERYPFASVYVETRDCLVKCVGSKGALEYLRQESEALGEEGREKQKKEHEEYLENCRKKSYEKVEKKELAPGEIIYSVHEKVQMVRNGVPGFNGVPLMAKNFAQFLEYPITKYQEADRVPMSIRGSQGEESPVEYELLEKLVLRCHANPYWLFDEHCPAGRAAYKPIYKEVPVFVTIDVIIKWMQEGKPFQTSVEKYWDSMP